MKLNFNIEKIISFAIAYLLSFLGLLNGINAITNAGGINTTLDTFVMYLLLWLMIIFVWVSGIVKGAVKVDVLFVTLLFISLFIITLLFFPENTKYIILQGATFSNNPIIVFFAYSYTGFIAVRNLEGYQHLLEYLRVFSYIIIVLSSIVFFRIEDSFANQYMTLSYNMLLQVCFLCIFPSRNRKVLEALLIGIGMFIVLFGGARGAALGLIIAVFLKVVSIELIGKKRIVLLISIVVGGAFLFFFYNQVLYILVEVIDKMGFTSRNLNMMITSGSDITSGRVGIALTALENLNGFGYGLYGDRVLLSGTYIHNLFLEWFLDFGIIGGSLGIVLYLVGLVYAWNVSDKLSRKIMMVLIPNGMIGLMFSSSYLLQQPAFFVLLGLCINIILKNYKGVQDESL